MALSILRPDIGMFHIVLVEPEIPPNTGNIIRLAANTGCQLHLIEPLGFKLDDARMRRAGLDYHEFAEVCVYDSFATFVDKVQPNRIWAFSSKVSQPFHQVQFSQADALVFGPETRGLSQDILSVIPQGHRLRIPMLETSRSLNLSNSVAIAVYQAWRQLDFQGAKL